MPCVTPEKPITVKYRSTKGVSRKIASIRLTY